MSITDEYVFFGGKRTARRNVATNEIHYYFADHLGSSRVVTNATGTIFDDSDFYPFGGERVVLSSSGNPYKFTGKERDAESGLDNFDFRYHSSSMGRFTKPDEPFGGWDQHDPQSFNLYSYVQNNPVTLTDPDGHEVRVCVDNSSGGQKGKQHCFNMSDQAYADLQKQQNGQNGINMPAGSMPNGNITCGGQVCGTARYFEPGLEDQTIQLMTLAEGLRGIAALGRLAYKSIAGLFARDAAEEGTVVIGKMADLNSKGALAESERTLDLPNLGSPKANWAQNSSKLREAMFEGKPIRDASAGKPGSNTGFLRAERNVLENHGWTLKDGYWYPPSK